MGCLLFVLILGNFNFPVVRVAETGEQIHRTG